MTTLIAYFILQASLMTAPTKSTQTKSTQTQATYTQPCAIGWDDND